MSYFQADSCRDGKYEEESAMLAEVHRLPIADVP